MKRFGKIYQVAKKERIIVLKTNKRLEYFHLTNKCMKDFKIYLEQKPYVIMMTEEEKTKAGHVKCRKVKYFEKIMSAAHYQTKVFYDLNDVKEGIKRIINRKENRLFLDLEFSLPLAQSRISSEIIQYGLVLENRKGEVVYSAESLLLPRNPKALNAKTLLFLSKTLSDFSSAATYAEFYVLMQEIMKTYHPRIYAWGENDILMLEKSFKQNNLPPLPVRKKYINLMLQVKNYYSLEQEGGLFKTYQELAKSADVNQMHDALEDSVIERKIFKLFQKEINKEI